MVAQQTRRRFAAAIIAFGALGVAGCGGAPSEGELNTKIVELLRAGGLEQAQAEAGADCLAPKLIDTLSDDALNQIMDEEVDAEMPDADDTPTDDLFDDGTVEDRDAMSAAIQECASTMVPTA